MEAPLSPFSVRSFRFCTTTFSWHAPETLTVFGAAQLDGLQCLQRGVDAAEACVAAAIHGQRRRGGRGAHPHQQQGGKNVSYG